jgi:hypothetical protein
VQEWLRRIGAACAFSRRAPRSPIGVDPLRKLTRHQFPLDAICQHPPETGNRADPRPPPVLDLETRKPDPPRGAGRTWFPSPIISDIPEILYRAENTRPTEISKKKKIGIFIVSLTFIRDDVYCSPRSCRAEGQAMVAPTCVPKTHGRGFFFKRPSSSLAPADGGRASQGLRRV